jgi:hypothetical protein
MRITSYSAVVVIMVSLFIACGNPGSIADPTARPSQAAADMGGGLALAAPSSLPFTMAGGRGIRQVTMMDACDGPTFNQVIGPGTCNRNGGVSFSEFVALLTAHQSAGAWRNAPTQTEAWQGDSLIAVNNGGEAHTFTRVANFGGGIIPFLNDLAGTPVEATECTTESDFVPPGGTDSESLDETGELKFQCCIHPWMRTTVLVKSH